MCPGWFTALLFKLQTPNRALRVVRWPFGAVLCPLKCWRLLKASRQGLVGIPRAGSGFRSRLPLFQGNGVLQKCLHSPVLGSRQTHWEREVRALALCCEASALPVSVHRSLCPVPLRMLSGRYQLLRLPCCRRKALEAGVVSHAGRLLFSLGCSRAWLLHLPLCCGGWQVSPTIVSWSSKPRAAAWQVLACRRGETLPTTVRCPLDLEHPPQIWFGGPPCSLAWPRGLDFFNPGLIM